MPFKDSALALLVFVQLNTDADTGNEVSRQTFQTEGSLKILRGVQVRVGSYRSPSIFPHQRCSRMSAEERLARFDEDARGLTNRAAVADARCAAQAKKSARGASAAARARSACCPARAR